MESENSEADTNQNMNIFLTNWNWYLSGPEKCDCENIEFLIQIDNNYKISTLIYRCSNYKCKKRFNLRINSFSDDFPRDDEDWNHLNILLFNY